MAQKPAEQLRQANPPLLESAFCATVSALKYRHPKQRSRCFCKKKKKKKMQKVGVKTEENTVEGGVPRQDTGVGS